MHKTFRDILTQLRLDVAFIHEMHQYFRIIRRHNGSSATMSNPAKLRALILRETHVLEKGMSLPSPHLPFGVNRAKSLISYLSEYVKMPDHDPDAIGSSMSTIKSYIEYNSQHGSPIPEVRQIFTGLEASYPNYPTFTSGGTVALSKSDIITGSQGDFEQLLKSRHSHRNFTDQPVPAEIIEKALKLASTTPSACNRQAWRTNIFSDAKAHDILQWQGGCRGFYDKIHTIIVVTSDLNSFFAHEPMQAYIDGGMYAMNLINSLHYVGLGTIPLSCGFSLKKLKHIHKYGIPENEIPILIVGIGMIPEYTNVAVSNRFAFTKTNTFHE